MAVCATAPLASCLDATEIKLVLSTDVACDIVKGANGVDGTHVLIHIGSPANIDSNPPTQMDSTACMSPDATTSGQANDLGTVAIVPSGGFDTAVAISVALSNDAKNPTSTCFPEGKGPASCIYAHRQISFLPHDLVSLPIVLSSICAGVSCVAPETCDPNTGKCTDGHIDVNDCGTGCSTDDAGKADAITTIDSPTFDVPVFDSPLEAGCLPNETKCNNVCVDLAKDAANCGACGFDCSGGSCTNGTCRLDVLPDASTSTFAGTCVALYSGAVWVSTSTGVVKVPVNGGSPSSVSSSKAFTLASYPSELARIEQGANATTIVDHATNQQYLQVNGDVAEAMAMSNKEYVWSDFSKGIVWVQPVAGGSPLSYYQGQQGDLIPVAVASTNVYWTHPSGFLYWATSNVSNTSVAAQQPGAVIVDDPTSTQPTVYVVVKGSQLISYDYKLTTPKPLATSSLVKLGALAWDGTTVYAIGATEIEKLQGSSMKLVASTVNADLRCIAVDKDAVYWLEQGGGLFKHTK